MEIRNYQLVPNKEYMVGKLCTYVSFTLGIRYAKMIQIWLYRMVDSA